MKLAEYNTKRYGIKKDIKNFSEKPSQDPRLTYRGASALGARPGPYGSHRGDLSPLGRSHVLNKAKYSQPDLHYNTLDTDLSRTKQFKKNFKESTY